MVGLFDSAICSSSSNVIVWLVGVNGFSEESVSGTFGPPAGGTGGGILPSKTSWYDVKVNFSLDSACVVSAKLLTSTSEVDSAICAACDWLSLMPTICLSSFIEPA
ncbi:hypothetical protein [Gimesia sp.]|uniref:hypothetical protein n=1 Tax=Gimesia sp. TaxID=2024833 RepID=UPI0025BED7BD|nr:hypothetical protein [Gimesia sp.]